MGFIVDRMRAAEGLDPDGHDLQAGDFSSLQEIAELLGGEVDADGKRVRCPSPGRQASDRSLVLRIDLTAPSRFFIYACDGSSGRAYRHVRERLKLSAPEASHPDAQIFALAIWRRSRPAAGSLVETYLRSRGLTLPIPTTLRFHDQLKHKPSGGWRPAMVGLVTNVDDRPVAIHRTYLRSDGSGKAPVDPSRMTLGKIEGCAVRLSPVAEEIAVGEGIETCLSVAQETGKPVWAALSVPGIKSLVLPSVVRSVVILADGDDEGERAARFAALRWRRDGLRVRIARPPRDMDFNDVLMRRVMAEKRDD